MICQRVFARLTRSDEGTDNAADEDEAFDPGEDDLSCSSEAHFPEKATKSIQGESRIRKGVGQ